MSETSDVTDSERVSESLIVCVVDKVRSLERVCVSETSLVSECVLENDSDKD